MNYSYSETFEKLHKTKRHVIPANAVIKYLFMVPRFYGDDAWIPAYAGMTGGVVFKRSHSHHGYHESLHQYKLLKSTLDCQYNF